MRTRSPLWAAAASLAALLALAFALYGFGLGLKYYGDDFQFYFDPPPSNPWLYFSQPNPNNTYAYRPIQAALLITIQAASGADTRLLHGLQIALHAGLAWAVYEWMRASSFSLGEAALGALMMLVSQANVHAILSNDTFSQISGALCGYLSLWALQRALFRRAPGAAARPRGRSALGLYGLSLALFLLALLSKETSVGFGLPLAGISVAAHPPPRWTASALARSLGRSAPFGLAVLLYWGWRQAVGLPGARLGSAPHELSFGLNLLVNTMLLTGQAWLAGSSVAAYAALRTRDGGPLLLMALATSALLLALAAGLRTSPRRRLALWAGAAGAASLLIAVPLNQASELYVYNAMPAVAVVAGAGLGGLAARLRGPVARGLLALGLTALFVVHVSAVWSKGALMRANGERAEAILQSVAGYAAEIPRDGLLLLVQPPSGQVEYSIFLMPGFKVLNHGLFQLNRATGRDDFRARIVSPAEAEQAAGEAALSLELDAETNQVVPYPRPAGR
ncbi:MAG: hypothetical protein IT318_04545 [Anaerolineales bacterium]|nr:hypothetical protein [Anaerolineales bacterium]